MVTTPVYSFAKLAKIFTETMAFLYHRRVTFADTDAAGRVHFSRLLCYIEEAEHTLLSELNIPLMGSGTEGGGWPRVHVDCDYFAPLEPSDAVEVVLIPEEVGCSSVNWSFNILRDGQDVAKGSMKTVRVDGEGRPKELQDDWRDRLRKV